ncbi:MAG: CsgG/HfaB family protein [Spirochaetota bacterium]
MNGKLKVFFISAIILSSMAIAFVNAAIAEQKPKRVAILELEAKNAPKPYAEIIRDLLEVKLQKSRLFDVLERNQIKMILNEQKFQLSDCSDSICAVQIGKILYADFVIVGSLSKIAKYTLSLKIVDVKNGSIILADTESAETDAELDKAAGSIVDRIARDIQSNNYGATTYSFNDERQKSGKAMDFGVYFRYGLIHNMEVPTIHIPNNYPEPFTLSEDKINTYMMELIIAPNIGLNNFIKLKPNLKYGWGLYGEAKTVGWKGINNEYTADSYYVYSYNSDNRKNFNFYSAGTGLSILFEYPFFKIKPFIGIGFGYNMYMCNNKNYVRIYNVSSSSISDSGSQVYSFTMDGGGNILYTEFELGFSAFITDKIGLTASCIYNYTIYGNLFQNIKITKVNSSDPNGIIPPEYQDLDKKINTSSWDDKRLVPILYLQAGVVYRL